MKKRLSRIVSDLPYTVLGGDLSISITGIAYDSNSVSEGNLFVCIKGFKRDGHDYALDAYRRGAKAFLVEKETDLPGAVVRVCNTRKALALVSKKFYGQPSIILIGITGTNGKTTTSYLTKSVLDTSGIKSGLIGTIEYVAGQDRTNSVRTTPEPSDLYKSLHTMESKGITHVVMEVTSHGLALERVHGLDFNCTAFTNLSHDHIDFHRTTENYRNAKLKLFRNLKGDAFSIVNLDDPVGREIAKISTGRVLTYALRSNADVTASFTPRGWEGSEITILSDGEEYRFITALIGTPNIYNVLAAFAIGRALRLKEESIIEGLAGLNTVPGRFEVVATDPRVVVDYAHTPDALASLLSSVKQLTRGKVISVFGCGGERDVSKRPAMGKISADLADLTIITSDNPRSEPPDSIISDIRKGVNSLSSDVRQCEDRREAIRHALTEASLEDTVVIAGRGHEKSQIIGNDRIPFDDREVTKEIHGSIRGRDR